MTHETVMTIAEWHAKTFPDATMEDQLRKFDEEMEEYERTPTFEELADMFIVACGLCRFDMVVAMSYMTIVATALNERKEIYASAVFPNKVDEKMAKNRNRTWEKTPQGNYHHTNTED